MADTHPCPGPGCDVTDVPDRMLMCRAHWYKVPKPLRDAVNRGYASGAGVGTAELRAAQLAAIRVLHRRADHG